MAPKSRRSFLRHMGKVGLAGALSRFMPGPATALAGERGVSLPRLTTRPSNGPIAEADKSTVVDLRNPMVIAGRQVHENALLGMIEKGICLVTDRAKTRDAWAALFSADDVIGIKFDEVGYEALGTTDVLAHQLVRSLEQAGLSRERIVLIEAPAALARKLGTKLRVFGWQARETSFGSGSERLASVLDQVTAILNVPFLKTDNIAGISGCLKNISLPFVYRQSPYFKNGCTPYIADIAALPQIRSKLRVHVVNGLRAVFDRGPGVHPDRIWRHGGILVSRDPVAADSISINLLDERRLKVKLPPIGDRMGRVPHVHTAARRGLGTDDPDYIRLIQPDQS